MSHVRDFYNQIQFPGHYSQDSLKLQSEYVTNPYLKIIDRHLLNELSVLDVGCGTGLISNLFALRYPGSHFTGVDFANSVDYARDFSKLNIIKNTVFVKQNFLDFEATQQYNRVICQGVLHHIPEAELAINKLKNLVAPGGLLMLGLYHPWGKLLKKYTNINYRNTTLFQDQEQNPYETSYTVKQVQNLFNEFEFVDVYPKALNMFVALPSLFNYRNGGLVTYILEKKS
jgi:SAM-dependent methyltransferase